MTATSEDQASGLRKWATRRQQAEASATQEGPEALARPPTPLPDHGQPPIRTSLIVVGLPPGKGSVQRVQARLGQWASLGRRWAMQPAAWDIRVLSSHDPMLVRYRHQVPHWAVWVDSHADAFAETFRTLKQVRQSGGAARLLALHEPGLERPGLLNHLEAAARLYLDIELKVLAH